jgi:retinoid hydroxylase
MTKQITGLSQVSITKDDVLVGRLAEIQARGVYEHGPVYWCLVENHFGAREYVCLVGPEANRFVLHTGREHFSHDGGWTPIIGEALGKGLLNTDPPEHTRYRKIWNPAFTSMAMEAYLPVIERVIAERTRAWPRQDVVDVLHEAREITFSAAAFALAGFEGGPQLEELRQLFYQQGQAEHAWRDRILLDLIAERRTRSHNSQPRDVLGTIVHARDEEGEPLSNQQILAHANNLLVAGHETTTTLSAWTLYLLATMPEHRRRIEAELDSLLGDVPGPLEVAALRGLHQLESFIKEVGRLYPPVLTVPRSVVRPVEFGGYMLPSGTSVRLALGASHLLPHVFAEPRRFDPDRFAPPREEDRRTPYGLVTFGGGPRICIGIHFAQIETKALVAHVLRRYRLQAVDDQPPANAGHLTALPHRIRLRVQPK